MINWRAHLLRDGLVGCDLVILASSLVGAYFMPSSGSSGETYGTLLRLSNHAWMPWVVLPTWIFLQGKFGLYDSASYNSLHAVLGRVVPVHCIGGVAFLGANHLMMEPDASRLFAQSFLIISFFGLAGEKIGVKFLLDHVRARRSYESLRKVVVVGTESEAERYISFLRKNPDWGMEPVALMYVDHNGAHRNGSENVVTPKPRSQSAVAHEEVSATVHELVNVFQHHVVDEVVAAAPWYDAGLAEDLLPACAETGKTFRLFVTMPKPPLGRYHVDDLGQGRCLISLETTPQAPLALALKRALDIIGACVGLVFFAMAYIWYAPRIRRESPGPVLFHQQRIGQNGRVFTLHKFRTMYADAEQRLPELLSRNEMRGNMFKLKDDPRLFPLGRKLRRRHIDELPQFWNILRGDMSLVGTRPPTPDEMARYDTHHLRRLSMKSGLTGLWQLKGNGKVSNFEDVVKLDCEYIDNWSTWLDLSILAQTLIKIVRGGGW